MTDPKVSGTIFIGAQHLWRTKDNGGDQAQLEAHCAGPGGVPEYDGTITCGDFVARRAGPHRGRRDRPRRAVHRLDGQGARAIAATMWVSTRLGRLFVTRNADAGDPTP